MQLMGFYYILNVYFEPMSDRIARPMSDRNGKPMKPLFVKQKLIKFNLLIEINIIFSHL